jgi:hypothetical protein
MWLPRRRLSSSLVSLAATSVAPAVERSSWVLFAAMATSPGMVTSLAMATSPAMAGTVEVSAALTAVVKAKAGAEECRRGGKVGSPPQNPPPSEAPPHSAAWPPSWCVWPGAERLWEAIVTALVAALAAALEAAP